MTHRNRQLLDLCHEAPCFLLLGHEGCGRDASVPVHSDMIRHGRGKDHKSHDCFAVPGCPVCHEHFKRSELGADGYHAAWTEAMERWILYLWVSEKICLATAPNARKEKVMEPPHCKICDLNHWSWEPHFGQRAVQNTSREGRRVLKAEAERPDATRTAATAKSQPATPPAKAANKTKAEKVRPGKPKTAPKGKKK